MNIKEYEKLDKEEKIEIGQLFYNQGGNKCCKICDYMIDGFCYKSNTWVSNLASKEITCYRLKKDWIKFLNNLTLEDFKTEKSENEYDYELLEFEEYFETDYITEKLLHGRLEEALDKYDEYLKYKTQS